MIIQTQAAVLNPFCARRGTLAAAALGLAALLVACGGGGDNTSTTSSGTPAAIEQGRWTNTVLAPGYTAIVQHKANAASSVWMLANDASSLAKLSLSGSGAGTTSGSATGTLFALGSTSSAVVAGHFSASGKTLTLSQVIGAQMAALELTASDTMATSLMPTQAAGNWSASATGLNVNWSVSTTGVISGTSTTGCTYSGQLSPTAGISLYEASFNENCAGTGSAYSGIATLNPAQTQMTVAATKGDNARAVALFFAR